MFTAHSYCYGELNDRLRWENAKQLSIDALFACNQIKYTRCERDLDNRCVKRDVNEVNAELDFFEG